MRDLFDDIDRNELGQLFPIILTEYDPDWLDRYTHESEVLSQRLQDNISRISHIGSTSVEGLLAKPTIDILLEIVADADPAKIRNDMLSLGYRCSEQPANPAPHMMFLKGYTEQGFFGQAFHVHLRYRNDWDELYFRDYLREHRMVAQNYANLKRELQKMFEHDRDAYTNAKTAFIKTYTLEARKEYDGRYASI